MHFYLRTLGLSLLLVTCHVMSAFGQEFEFGGLNYSITSDSEDSEQTVAVGENPDCNGDVIIPSQAFNEGIVYSVTSIDAEAFCDCYDLTSITIPNTVEEIGAGAFSGCDNLTSVICLSTQPAKIGKTTFSGDYTIYVPLGCLSVYKNTKAKNWSKLNIVELGKKLTDGEEYTQKSDTILDLLYTRNFKNTDWQPLYVPFAIPVEELSSLGLSVAALKKVPAEGDEATLMEFSVLTTGVTEPNHPYLIKSEMVGEVSLTLLKAELKAAQDNSIQYESETQRFTFVGTLTGVSGKEMYNNKYYGMAGGSLKQVSSENVALRPQRWYMKVENLDGSAVGAASIRFVVNEASEEETTGICTMPTVEPVANDAIYNLSGVRMSAKAAKSGLYVRNGKTIFVR